MRTSPRGRLALPLCALLLTLSLAACDKTIDPSAHGTATHAGTARLYLVDEDWPCPTAAKEIVKEVCEAQRRFVPLVHKRDLSDSMKKNLVKSSESFLIRFNSAFIKYIRKAGVVSDKGRLIVVAAFESTGVSSSLSNATESYVVFGSEGQTRGSFLDFDDWPMVGPVTVPSGDLLLRLVIINSVQKEKEDLKKAVDIVSSLAGSVNPSTSMAMKVANPVATMLISMLSDQVIFDHRFALRQSSDTTRSYANELRYGTYALVQQEDVLLEDDINKQAPQSGYVPNVGEMRFDLKSHRLHKMYTFDEHKQHSTKESISPHIAATAPSSGFDISSFDILCSNQTDPTFPTHIDFSPAYDQNNTINMIVTQRKMATLRRTIAVITASGSQNSGSVSGEDKIRKERARIELNELLKQNAEQAIIPSCYFSSPEVCDLWATEKALTEAERAEADAYCDNFSTVLTFDTCGESNTKDNRKLATANRASIQVQRNYLFGLLSPYLGQVSIGVSPSTPGPIKRHPGLNRALQRMFYESSRSAGAQKMSVRYFEKDGKPVDKDSLFDTCTGERTKRHYLPFSATYYPQYNTILGQYALHTNLVFSVEQVNTAAYTIAVRHKTYTDAYKAKYISGNEAVAKTAEGQLKIIGAESLAHKNVIDVLQRTDSRRQKAEILNNILCENVPASNPPSTKKRDFKKDQTTLGVEADYMMRVGSLIGIPNPTCDEIQDWIIKNP